MKRSTLGLVRYNAEEAGWQYKLQSAQNHIENKTMLKLCIIKQSEKEPAFDE